MPCWTPVPPTRRDWRITRWAARLQLSDGHFDLLTHLNPTATLPQRTVVIGAGGFVGGGVVARLKQQGANVLAVTRQDVDLLATDAAATLKALLQPEDAVVAAAARAPCKDMLMLID